jgi:hypothetical protein
MDGVVREIIAWNFKNLDNRETAEEKLESLASNPPPNKPPVISVRA